MTMLICTLIRPGGTKVTFGGQDGAPPVQYHFKPNEAGHHVEEVLNRQHKRRFLSIEGYDEYEDYLADLADGKADTDEDDDDDDDDFVVTDDDDTDEDGLGAQGSSAPIQPEAGSDERVVAPGSGTVEEAGSDDGDTSSPAASDDGEAGADEGEGEPESETDEEDDNAGNQNDGLDDMDDEALAAIFKEEFGRAVNPKAKRETIIERIRENRAED